MLGINNRLIQARHAANPSTHIESKAQAAGRAAEKDVADILQKLGNIEPSNIYKNLRVPNDFQTGRCEIDLVLMNGEGIYCIEVKNWAGKIVKCKTASYWQQIVSQKDGHSVSKQMQHLNPVAEIKKKTSLLRGHLLKAGICLAESKFYSYVVLTNRSSKIDEEIEKDPNVICPGKIQDFASKFNKTFSASIIDSITPSFFSGMLSYNQLSQTEGSLKQIGTWDIIELNGGKQLYGDFKGCAEINIDRKEVSSLEYSHQRNVTWASVWAVLGYAPVVTVSLMKRGGVAGWFGSEVVRSLTIPYNSSLLFRIVGDSVDAKIPVNDIRKVTLSI